MGKPLNVRTLDDLNIVQHRRAFSSLDEMNVRGIAQSWERRGLPPNDLGLHPRDLPAAVRRVKHQGRKTSRGEGAIVGNHDNTAALYTRGFATFSNNYRVRLPPFPGRRHHSTYPRQLFLCHYPFVSWPEKGNGCTSSRPLTWVGRGLIPSRRAGTGPGEGGWMPPDEC